MILGWSHSWQLTWAPTPPRGEDQVIAKGVQSYGYLCTCGTRHGVPDLTRAGLVRRGGEPEAVSAMHFTQNEHSWSLFKTGKVDRDDGRVEGILPAPLKQCRSAPTLENMAGVPDSPSAATVTCVTLGSSLTVSGFRFLIYTIDCCFPHPSNGCLLHTC